MSVESAPLPGNSPSAPLIESALTAPAIDTGGAVASGIPGTIMRKRGRKSSLRRSTARRLRRMKSRIRRGRPMTRMERVKKRRKSQHRVGNFNKYLHYKNRTKGRKSFKRVWINGHTRKPPKTNSRVKGHWRSVKRRRRR